VLCSWCNDVKPETKCKSCDAVVHLSPDCSVAHPPQSMLHHCIACLCMVCGAPPSGDPLTQCMLCGARVHRPNPDPDQKSCCFETSSGHTECGPCRATYLLKEEAEEWQGFLDTHYDEFNVRLSFTSTPPVDYKTLEVSKTRYSYRAPFVFCHLHHQLLHLR
jgi:hypothetical protein